MKFFYIFIFSSILAGVSYAADPVVKGSGTARGQDAKKNVDHRQKGIDISEDDVFDLYDRMRFVTEKLIWSPETVVENVEELQRRWRMLLKKLTILTPSNAGAENLVKLKTLEMQMTKLLNSLTVENVTELKSVWYKTEKLLEIIIPYPGVTVEEFVDDMNKVGAKIKEKAETFWEKILKGANQFLGLG